MCEQKEWDTDMYNTDELMPLKSTLALCLPGIGLAQANSSAL
jgi:hypothetical protein